MGSTWRMHEFIDLLWPRIQTARMWVWHIHECVTCGPQGAGHSRGGRVVAFL